MNEKRIQRNVFIRINEDLPKSESVYSDIELHIDDDPDKRINGRAARHLFELCSQLLVTPNQQDRSIIEEVTDYVNLSLQYDWYVQDSNPTLLTKKILKGFLKSFYNNSDMSYIERLIDTTFQDLYIPYRDSSEIYSEERLNVAWDYLSDPTPSKYSDQKLAISTPNKMVQYSPSQAMELIRYYYEINRPRKLDTQVISPVVPTALQNGELSYQDASYIISYTLFGGNAMQPNAKQILLNFAKKVGTEKTDPQSFYSNVLKLYSNEYIHTPYDAFKKMRAILQSHFFQFNIDHPITIKQLNGLQATVSTEEVNRILDKMHNYFTGDPMADLEAIENELGSYNNPKASYIELLILAIVISERSESTNADDLMPYLAKLSRFGGMR